MERETENAVEPSSDRAPTNFAVWLWKQARRVVVFIVGSTVLLIGIVMIVAPGPAVIVIPLGLAILATEFVWARRWLKYARQKLDVIVQKATSSKDKDNVPNPKA